jgi:hypothetical protein
VSVFNSHVPAFRVGAFLQDKHTGERLRAALQHFGVSATGNKEELTHKLATLSAKLYRNHLPTLDRFFARNSFIRIQNVPPDTREIPVLEDLNSMRNMVLTLYAMKHLRGDTILEAGHQNDTYTVEELALALVTGKVSLTGAFMRVT